MGVAYVFHILYSCLYQCDENQLFTALCSGRTENVLNLMHEGVNIEYKDSVRDMVS